MPDSSLYQVLSRIAKQTMESQKPCDYLVGTVVAVDPIEIKISNSLTIDEDFIDFARAVTDYEVEISISDSWSTENTSGGSSYGAFDSHKHDIKGSKKTIKIHNALEVGEKVLMIQKAKGQKYTVIDRVVSL